MSAKPIPRLKVSPIRGRRPVLQNCTIAELAIDPLYQRSTDNGGSQALIRAIARDWDWSLCQPLVVAQRQDMGLFVVDGQHRLAAARLRGDIYDLPCVITTHGSPKEEAAAFVALNQQRKPLSALDLFKAALAGGDEQAAAMMSLIQAAGLELSPHENWKWWKPGQIANVGGLRRCQSTAGDAITGRALKILARAFDGQVLRFGGTIFAGLWPALVAIEEAGGADDDLLALLLSGQSQPEWVQEFLRIAGADSIHRNRAATRAIRTAYEEAALEAAEEAA